MRTIKILVFYFLMLVCEAGMSQSNFLKGYYITAYQDTIRGLIDYRSQQRNYKLFIFKLDEFSTTIFYPVDVKGFVIEDQDFYETHVFTSKSGEDIKGFFKVLVSGKLSLLRYRDRFYAKNSNGEIFEISKRKMAVDWKSEKDYTGIDYTRIDHTGLGILKVLVKGCSEITAASIEEAFEKSNFVSLFKTYNQCVGSSYQETRKVKIKSHIDFGLQAAFTSSQFNFGYPLNAATFNTSRSFNIGGFASIFLPKVNEHFRLVVEATYSQNNFYSYFSSDLKNNDVFVSYSFVKVPIVLRYQRGIFFGELGVNNQLTLHQQIKWRVESSFQNVVVTENGQIDPLPLWGGGVVAGAGLKFKVMDSALSSSFRFTNNLISSNPLKPASKIMEFILAFQF